MKTKPMLLATALLLATRLFAQEAAPAPALAPGSEVKPDALQKGEWIQGEALAAWEPGKVYMLECWATWCGPCVAIIPHVNELHKKYSEKGLRVIGVNVWEDGKEKVAKFVEGKGDGMSYPIVYTGRGSDFEKDWLKAAGVSGIPHAFLVRDGKLILKSHPARITDEVINAALEGGEALAQLQEKMGKAEAAQGALMAAMRSFTIASNKKDVAAMEEALAKIKEVDVAGRFSKSCEADLAMAKKDWDAVTKILETEGKNPMVVMRLARMATGEGEVPQPVLEALTTSFTSLTSEKGGPMELQIVSRLQWKQEKKEDALASARAAVEKAKEAKATRAGFPVEPFEKFAAALEEGKMPTDQEFNGWLQESLPKRPAPKPVQP